MTWINFLHFYQPANAADYIIDKALEKSYWRLLRLMEEHPELRMTWNFSGCLLERLEKNPDFLARLKFLVKKGRVELVGSAAYHGFLPLLPVAEVKRQIKANEKILRRHFGRNFKPTGFFLPEMAYSSVVARIIKRLGYSWIILDEISYSGNLRRQFPGREVFLDDASGLKVVFRSREQSSAYPPDQILAAHQKFLKSEKAAGHLMKDRADDFYLTATDAELYGLRHEDPTAELEKLVKIKDLKTMTISALIKNYRKKPVKINLYPASWEATPAEIKSGRPYVLWQDKNNQIQSDLWRLANLALSLEVKFKQDKNFYWYRWHLVRGLASCTFWWASARDFSKIFGPYAWSPDEIERGLEDLVRSVRSLAAVSSKKYKLEAEKYYLRIKKNIWREHWKKRWQKII